ncbi:tRNA lysidine(34) synthetase TilS [Bifidobacterium dolichotidis]|nr:tRNA lysidine(34) synthetase TilS [Bifidobacterium dolichotidis]
MKSAIGAVRTSLGHLDRTLVNWDPQFVKHGHHEIRKDAPVIAVACSGGRDSLALAASAQKVCASWGIRCAAIIVDHGLQQNSDVVAAQAAQQCADLGLDPVIVERITIRASDMRHRGVEAAARQQRYDAIVNKAREIHARAVLLAHTRDDQAETVLIDLLTAGSLDGMAGMADSIDIDGIPFLRPLLGLSRADTTNICKSLNLEYWDDPTNGDDLRASVIESHTQETADTSSRTLDSCATCVEAGLGRDLPLRSRIRNVLLPWLSEFTGGNMVTRLATFAQTSRPDIEFLQEQADLAFRRAVTLTLPEDSAQASVISDDATDNGQILALIDLDVLNDVHLALRRRVMATLFSRFGIRASSAHVAAAVGLTRGNGGRVVQLPAGYVLKRVKHVIRLCHDDVHANRGYSGKH